MHSSSKAACREGVTPLKLDSGQHMTGCCCIRCKPKQISKCASPVLSEWIQRDWLVCISARHILMAVRPQHPGTQHFLKQQLSLPSLHRVLPSGAFPVGWLPLSSHAKLLHSWPYQAPPPAASHRSAALWPPSTQATWCTAALQAAQSPHQLTWHHATLQKDLRLHPSQAERCSRSAGHATRADRPHCSSAGRPSLLAC